MKHLKVSAPVAKYSIDYNLNHYLLTAATVSGANEKPVLHLLLMP